MKVPKDLVECIEFLVVHFNHEQFRKYDPILFHDSVGRWMRNTWGLWDDDSELRKFFNSIGIFHADDMSGIILDTFHKILNKKPVELKRQVNSYEDYCGQGYEMKNQTEEKPKKTIEVWVELNKDNIPIGLVWEWEAKENRNCKRVEIEV